MEYERLVSLYQKLEETDSDLEKTTHLAEFYRENSGELDQIVLLSFGRLFPSWKNMDLGVSSKTVVEIIKTATGREKKEIETAWRDTGDLGSAAEQMVEKKTQQRLISRELTVESVNEKLHSVATQRKTGLSQTVDQSKKVKELAELISAADPEEAKYLARTFLRNLRLGVGEGSVRDALNEAFFDEDKKELIQRKMDLTNDILEVAKACREGTSALNELELEVFRPINSMLAKNVDSISEGFDEVGRPAAIDFKYDGMRCQVHSRDGEIKLYTRRLEDVTDQFPDVVQAVNEHIDADEFIFDSEIVGRDENGEVIPFQQLSRRIKRKYNIQQMKEEIPVVIRPFDLIQLEGDALIDTPYSERWNKLVKIVSEASGEVELVDHAETGSESEVQDLKNNAMSQGHEGVMMKNLSATYKPGSRVGYMVKIKSTMESLDLAVIGAKWSEGRRSGWLGRLKIGCWDPEDEEYKSVGQVSTGLTDEQLEEITEELKPLILNEDGRDVDLRPELILEVEYEEIQESPEYGSGYALRFPRVVGIRWEKSEADSLEKVRSLFNQQH